jgi:hypothetical protein
VLKNKAKQKITQDNGYTQQSIFGGCHSTCLLLHCYKILSIKAIVTQLPTTTGSIALQ